MKTAVEDWKMKRDPKVELMRIIACAIVIGTHTYLPLLVDGIPDSSHVFIACLFSDGVAVFWLINGFFLFKNKSYAKLMRHTAKHILVPMLLISVFGFYLGEWITKGATLRQSVLHSPEDYKNLLNGLLSWSNAVSDLGHLWYLYAYVLLMLLFPVLKSFADYLGEDAKREKAFLIISAAFLLFNDISGNRFGSFSHHTINACFPAAIEILWGHILYKHRALFSKRLFMAAGFAGFLVLNVLRFGVQLHNYEIDISDITALYWYTLTGTLCAVCIAVFCLSTGLERTKSTRTGRFICFLASHTMNIYLVHIFVRNFLSRYGFQSFLRQKLFAGGQNFFYEALYSAAQIVVIFIISLAVSVAVKTPGILAQRFSLRLSSQAGKCK